MLQSHPSVTRAYTCVPSTTLLRFGHDYLSPNPDINAVTSALDGPWLHAAGNHDMDTDAKGDADALQTFRRHFGPDTFAREEALATSVLLDDVIHRPGMKPAYTGGFREDQFAFLEAYLPTVQKESSDEPTSELQ